jgi:ubiquinone/menaquinone biosynthesis C-methylase UbiE
MRLIPATLLFLVLLIATSICSAQSNVYRLQVRGSPYETRAEHDPNGIGKFYMGREIAHVMGHEAADWLERPEREKEERTDLLVPALKLRPGDVVADIGCGSGYYARRLAKVVGVPLTRSADTLSPSDGERDGVRGIVYAVDIQQEMLDLLTNRLAREKIVNVRPVLGTITSPNLPPASVDLILMVDVYHEFDYPFEMVEGMCRALRQGGRIVFVEYRAEDLDVPIKRMHKMSEAQVRKEMSVQPLEWIETIRTLPQQHVIIFRKKP